MTISQPTTDPFHVRKECRQCLEVKEISAFYLEKSGQPRLDCKTCCRAQAKESRERLKAQHAQTPCLPQSSKRCRKCLEVKDAGAFYLKNTGQLTGRCKACFGRAVAASNAQHRERKLAYNRRYYAANGEKMRADSAAYHGAHREECTAKMRAYYAAHSDLWRAYYADHPEVGRRHNDVRRAHQRSTLYIEDVDVAVLYIRDKGICGICHRPVTLAEASRDHIIPVTYGGETSYKNMQLAHLRCNIRRGNRNRFPVQYRLF